VHVMPSKAPLLLSVCRVDLGRCQVHRDDEVRLLSTREAELLAYLAARPGQAVTREELYREVWGYAAEVASRTLDVTVRRLREKVEGDQASPQHIITVRGVGYRFDPQQAESNSQPVEGAASSSAARGTTTLFGRDDDLTALRAVLERGVVLLSILGPPGVGKRALAAELATGRPSVLVLEEPDDLQLEQAMADRAGRTVVATSVRARRMRGEHRHVLLPLAQEDGVQALVAELERRRIPGLASRRTVLAGVAGAMGGNPLLLVAVGERLAERAREVGLKAALRDFDAQKWLTHRVLLPEGEFRQVLDATWSDIDSGARSLLERAAAQPTRQLRLDDIGALCPEATADDLQDLLDHSALLRTELVSGLGFLLPEPLRTYIRARRAASVAVASHS